MQSTKTLRRGKLFLFISFFAVILNLSCQKEKHLFQSSTSLNVVEAKQYFEEHFNGTGSGEGTSGLRQVNKQNANNPFDSKKPIWNKAIEKNATAGNIIRVPLDFGSLYVQVRNTTGLLPVNALHYLVMYKDKKDSIRTEWVTFTPDSAWLYGQRNSYSGSIEVKTWEGTFIRGFSSRDGAIKQFVNPEYVTGYESSQNGRNVEKKSKSSSDTGGGLELDPNCDYYMYEDEEHTPHLLFKVCYSPYAPCLNCPTEAEDHFEDDTDPDNYGGGGTVTTYYDYQPDCETDITSTTSTYPAPTGVQWNIDCTGVPVLKPSDPQLPSLYDPQNPFDNLDLPIDVPQDDIPASNIQLELIPQSPPPGTVSRKIAVTENRNNTEDMQHGTDGDLSGLDIIQDRHDGTFINLDQLSDADLFAKMESLFYACAIFDSDMQQVGQEMINRFKSNTGAEYSSLTLNQKVVESTEMSKFLIEFGNALNVELKKFNGDVTQVGPIDLQSRPVFNGLYNKFHGLQITVNDTEYTEVYLDNFDFDPASKEWQADVTVVTLDHFGLDKHDAVAFQSKHNGFLAWWLLQHRRDYKPFQTKITIRRRIKGSTTH